MLILWDEPKRLTTLDKHGLDFSILDEAFFTSALIIPAKRGRYLAVGRLSDGTVVVIFAYLGTEAISVVSMRHASRQERRMLDEQR